MTYNLPNLLTLLRIVLIPVLVLVYYLPVSWAYAAAAFIFGLAAVTDWLDGYLARKLNQESAFGAFMDPVADKLIVVVAIVLLVEAHPQPWLAIPSMIIISREVAVSALREWMAELGKRAAVKVSFVGKLKTTAQLASILLMIYYAPLFGLPTFQVGLVLYYIAALLTLYSMIIYLRAAWPMLTEKDSHRD